MNRRTTLSALAALPLAAIGCGTGEPNAMNKNSEGDLTTRGPASGRAPVVFAAHGAPVLLDDAEWMSELAAWGRALPKPSSVLMISAHWAAPVATTGAISPTPLVYDFYGFPEKYYQSKYPAPPTPELAERVGALLDAARIPRGADGARGLDHGAYVPLMGMFPEANIPVLQLSLPPLIPTTLVDLGRALASLRDEGVLIFGSGFLTHNMRFAFRRDIPSWATEFDDWARGALERLDIDALAQFQALAPGASMALPTWEHYAPVLVAAGAAVEGGERTPVTFPIKGWWMDSAFTKRSVQFG
ncbi:MAG: class III extradiol ring-cleavage dioxygenase [Polyangiaceae bacterium]